MRYAVVFITLMAVSFSVGAEMYKCTDARGKVNFTDKPCKTNKQEVLKEKTHSKPTPQPESKPHPWGKTTFRNKPATGSTKNCHNTFYSSIIKELNAAYNELGRPAVEYSSMVNTRRKGMAKLKERRDEWPTGLSYEVGVTGVGDHVYLKIECDGKKKQGKWRP